MNSFIFAAAPLCNPSAAQLCAAVDDNADIYINGTYIDTFPYCNVGNACSPKCISLSTAQLALLSDTGNMLAVYNQNTQANEVWASWSLDITCAAGHSIISSARPTILMSYDTTCMSSGPNPSPTPYLGKNWYDITYTTASGWNPPVIMTGQKYGQRLMDPSTGSLLPAESYVTSGPGNGCGAMWFREPFDLTPVPTPLPPAFTITKSANPSSNIGLNTPYEVTFTLHICNTGGGTFGNPVTINDNWNDAVDGWQFVGGNYTDPIFGSITASGSGKTATITFADGFPNNACYDYTYTVKMYSGQPTFCAVWHNIADLSYLVQPVIEATVTLNDYCPPPPNFTLVKTSSETTVNANDQISYNLHLCNTGGAAWQGTATIFDDMTSAPNQGSWQFTNPYYVGSGLPTGIDHYSTAGGNTSRTYTITFTQPGFTGCVDIPYNVKNANGWGCGPWHNDATFSYYASPVVISTVSMVNACTPTFTITPSSTYSPTRTLTNTPTVTRTITTTVTATPTITVTPPIPNIQLTKTEDKTIVMLGENIQYCFNYTNAGVLPATFTIWDTIPVPMDFVSCTGGCTQSGGMVIWTINNLPAGNSGSVCFIAKAARLPFFMRLEEYFAMIFDRKNNVADGNRSRAIDPVREE
jgi:uncharacterized repeat protein (TIGR01451 family)